MLESLRHNGNLYLGWDLSNPEEREELKKQMGTNPKEAQKMQSDESQRLADLEAALAELAFGAGQ